MEDFPFDHKHSLSQWHHNTRPNWQSFPLSPCKGTCLGACLWVDSACCGSGGVLLLWGEPAGDPSTLSTETQDLPLVRERQKERPEGWMTTGQEQERMLTLRKLECGEAEQLPWMCCTRSFHDLVGGLLCMLLLHWLLDRENLVLETENRRWSHNSPQKVCTISAHSWLSKQCSMCDIAQRDVHL